MTGTWPRLSPLGVDGLLITFGDRLSETANRAALALRAALEAADLPGACETSTALASAYLRFDPARTDRAALIAAVEALMRGRDWYDAPLPDNRRLWRIPTVFDPELAPQLDEAAAAAGLDRESAIASLTARPLRVQTIGFAPGQPYLGSLDPEWDIPRQQALTDRVPVGALTVAIRQLVLFTVSTPTGWRHVGQTAFRGFRPESGKPFVLRPGDEVQFVSAPAGEYDALKASGPDGGATCGPLP
ncbi:MAG: allophanate hydrolase subunit 1 [Rhodobacteraceae bacterium]|nr:allophanate hydrolase subunit 1 [Paracoccaceae bacterium]